MKKQFFQAVLTKRNLTYLLVGLVMVTIVLAYPLRGFIRNTILPLAAQNMYASGVNAATMDIKEELQRMYPFGKITYIFEDKASCQLSDAHYFRTEVYCSTYLFRGQASIDKIPVDDFAQKAQAFENSLKTAGWSPSGSNDGVNRSYDSPYGWWYLAQYSKTIGKVQCDMYVERDNDPKLLNMYVGCDRRAFFF